MLGPQDLLHNDISLAQTQTQTHTQIAEKLIHDEMKLMQKEGIDTEHEALTEFQSDIDFPSSFQNQQKPELPLRGIGHYNALILDDLAVMAVCGPVHWQRTLDSYRQGNAILRQVSDQLSQETMNIQTQQNDDEDKATQILNAETTKWKSNMRALTDRLYL